MREGSRQNGVYSPSYFADDSPRVTQVPLERQSPDDRALPMHASPHHMSPKVHSPFYNSPRPGHSPGSAVLEGQSPRYLHQGQSPSSPRYAHGHLGHSPHEVYNGHNHHDFGVSSPYSAQSQQHPNVHGSGGTGVAHLPTSPYNYASSPMAAYNPSSPYSSQRQGSSPYHNHGNMLSPARHGNELGAASPHESPCA
jgi:hypothetical protein